MNKSALFYPLVDGVVPTKWYRYFLSVGKEKGMWSMWFIYYAHHHKLWTVGGGVVGVGMVGGGGGGGGGGCGGGGGGCGGVVEWR